MAFSFILPRSSQIGSKPTESICLLSKLDEFFQKIFLAAAFGSPAGRQWRVAALGRLAIVFELCQIQPKSKNSWYEFE